MTHKIKEHIAYRRVSGDLFIVDAAASRLHELNGPAALIWEGIAAGKSGPAIISDILSEFDTDEQTARADISEFTEELVKLGLLTGGKR